MILSNVVRGWSLLAVLPLLWTSLLAEEGTGIKGRVVDAVEHAPIPNAYVLVHRKDAADKSSRTDANGRYSIDLPSRVYDVLISAEGFSPTCRKIEVQPDGKMIFDAILDGSAVGMQQ